MSDDYKDIIIGGGEIGTALFQLIDTFSCPAEIEDRLQERSCILDLELPVYFMHVCIPYINFFGLTLKEYANKYNPKAIIIHSTVPPGTGEKIQNLFSIPVISSPIRGVHEKFPDDLQKYVKWFGFNGLYDQAVHCEFIKRFTDSKIEVNTMSNGKTCETAKIICDTTYQGWLIAFKYASDMIAEDYGVDPEEIWKMNCDVADKPYRYSDPEGIGGHCIMPNLELIDNNEFKVYMAKVIRKINDDYKERFIKRQ